MTRLIERARARNPFPEGTIRVGGGFVVAGLTIYAFLAVAARALGPERYAPLATLWAVVFLAAPGLYFPLEQEVARALSDRHHRGLGGAPVIRRAALLAAASAGVLGVALAATSGLLLDELFAGEALLLAAVPLTIIAYAGAHLARGTLAGHSRFRSYAVLVGAEGVIRLLAGVVLAVAGVKTAGPYGLLLGVAPLLAIAISIRRERGLMSPGPQAEWAELTRALGYLLVGSVLAQALINVTPLAVQLLAERDEQVLVGKVLIALIVARVPVFMLQAVQASLIPKLAGLAAARRLAEFRAELLRLMGALGLIGLVFTFGAIALGPWVVEVFFGSEFALGRPDMGYLAAASMAFMGAHALGQALISLASYRRAAFGWFVGMVTFGAVAALPTDLLFRVERAFLAASATALATMTVMLLTRMRRPAPEPEELLFATPTR